MKKKAFLCFTFGLLISVVGIQATPSFALHTPPPSIVFDLNFAYSGAPPAETPPPWLTATFVSNSDGSVRLSMEATNLAEGEFISKWYFNFNPIFDSALELGLLDAVSVDPTDDVAGWSFKTEVDKLKAGPDGFYDLRFEFDTSNGSTGNRFIDGETMVFDLVVDGFSHLVPQDFDFLSGPGDEPGDKGPFRSAAHIQGIESNIDDSGWIAPNPNPNPVPEPATMLLVGMGLVGLAGFGRRRFKK